MDHLSTCRPLLPCDPHCPVLDTDSVFMPWACHRSGAEGEGTRCQSGSVPGSLQGSQCHHQLCHLSSPLPLRLGLVRTQAVPHLSFQDILAWQAFACFLQRRLRHRKKASTVQGHMDGSTTTQPGSGIPGLGTGLGFKSCLLLVS